MTQDTLVASTEAPNGQSKYLTFDFKTQKWADLFTDTVENYIVSLDGKYIYYTTLGRAQNQSLSASGLPTAR